MLQLIHKQWNISEIKEIKHDEYIFWELAYTYLVRLQYIIGDGICHYSVPVPLILDLKLIKTVSKRISFRVLCFILWECRRDMHVYVTYLSGF